MRVGSINGRLLCHRRRIGSKNRLFSGVPCVGCVFGRLVGFRGVFGAVLGLVWAVRGSYPIGINTPPLRVGVREKGRVTPPLPEQIFLKRVKKGAKGDFEDFGDFLYESG